MGAFPRMPATKIESVQALRAVAALCIAILHVLNDATTPGSGRADGTLARGAALGGRRRSVLRDFRLRHGLRLGRSVWEPQQSCAFPGQAPDTDRAALLGYDDAVPVGRTRRALLCERGCRQRRRRGHELCLPPCSPCGWRYPADLQPRLDVELRDVLLRGICRMHLADATSCTGACRAAARRCDGDASSGAGAGHGPGLLDRSHPGRIPVRHGCGRRCGSGCEPVGADTCGCDRGRAFAADDRAHLRG